MNSQLPNKLSNITKQALIDSIAIKNHILSDDKQLSSLINISQIIVNSLQQGGKLLLCGNGGSAADAQHLATELLVRLRSKVNRNSLPAIALAMDTSMLTATGNDYGFDEVFSRPLSGLGKSGDVLLGISTSGKSKNVIKAFELARNMNITTIGFLGDCGGTALNWCDYAFIVPSNVTARIQEVHITAGHIIMELIEEQLLATGFLTKINLVTDNCINNN